jgi:hypothetical protein
VEAYTELQHRPLYHIDHPKTRSKPKNNRSPFPRSLPKPTIADQFSNIILRKFCYQITKWPIGSPSHTQKNDVQEILSIYLKRTLNCQWGMQLANGYAEVGGSPSPPYPQHRRRCHLEKFTQQNRHTTTAAPMEYTKGKSLPLVPRNQKNHRPHVFRLPLSHSFLEPFSQGTPRITRPPPTAEETYTVWLFHPRYYSPTTCWY